MKQALVLLLALSQSPAGPSPIERARDEVLAAGIPAGYAAMDPYFIAVYDPNTRSIYLNTQAPYWRDPAAAQLAMYCDGQMSTSSAHHIVRHELAHAELHKAVGTARMNDMAAWLPMDVEAVKAEVGAYAAKNCVEFCAEVSAGLKARKTYSDKIMGQYRALTRP